MVRKEIIKTEEATFTTLVAQVYFVAFLSRFVLFLTTTRELV